MEDEGRSMKPSRPRVVRIANILPPYRLPAWQALQQSGVVHFETWLMANTERNRQWAESESHSLDVRVFRDWGIDLSHRDMLIVHFNPRMLRELSRNPPDLVILGGYESLTCITAVPVLSRLGIPFLFGIGAVEMGSSRIEWLTRPLLKKVIGKSSGVMVPGSAAREHVLLLGAPPDRVYLTPYSVDIDRFRPLSPGEKEKLRSVLGLPSGIICLFVGALIPRKGVDVLLEGFRKAARNWPDAHLVILGEGPLGEILTRKVSSDPVLTDRVHMLGHRSYEALPDYYGMSDVFVFPTRDDIWGMVLNEAMSSGLPVISSDHARGAWDLIEDGISVFTFPSGDAAALSVILESLLKNADLREEVGRQARERIMDGFTPEHSARAVMQTISKILELT